MNSVVENKSSQSSQPSQGFPSAGLSLWYPFDWTGIEDFSEYRFTAENLPTVYLGKGLGWRFYPITIAQWGLFRLQKFAADHDSEAQRDALAAADWLVANARSWGRRALVWIHDWPLTFYGTPAPWISAMAQGEAISLLVRAHLISQKTEYLRVAEGAFVSFVEGIVCSHYPDGSLSLEEYPANPPAHVLNGAVFASLGVFDYAVYRRDPRAVQLWHEAVEGIARNLHRYDTGFWTRYDLFPVHRLASRAYHEIHIRQMGLLHDLTSHSVFASYRSRWRAYQRDPHSRVRWALGKVLEKVRIALRNSSRPSGSSR